MGRIANLSQIPEGTTIFIDANIFIYHFIYETAGSHLCSSLLKCIENGSINGFTSAIVLAEVAHRLMIFEAIEKYGLENKNILRFLKENPGKTKVLHRHHAAVNEIQEMGVRLIAVEPHDIFVSQTIQTRYGLLTNDSINVQIMLKHSIFDLASNDSDFERVDFITLYKPVA